MPGKITIRSKMDTHTSKNKKKEISSSFKRQISKFIFFTKRSIKNIQDFYKLYQVQIKFIGKIIGSIAFVIGVISGLVGIGVIQPILIRKPLTGEFNIAVANFSTPEGRKSKKGEEIALVFFRRLETELNEFTQQNDLIKVIDILPSSKTGYITGKTFNDRAINARRLANKLNVQMMVYGTIEESGGSIIVTPEFLIDNPYIKDAEEIFGQYRLGNPIVIDAVSDNLSSHLMFNQELSDRSSALALITLGLFNYFAENYKDALFFYEQADAFQNWKREDGKEILYVLMGNAAIRGSQSQESEKYYRNAIDLNPEYARGYIGLATYTFRNAIQDSNKIDFNRVRDSITYFDKALDSQDKPEYSFIETKAHFGLGEAKLLLTQAGQNNSIEEAKNDFIFVTNNYDLHPDKLLWERAAQAYAHLGLIAYIQGSEMDIVKGHYQDAVNIAEAYDRDLAAKYWEKLAGMYIEQNDLISAKEFLNQALKIVDDVDEKHRIEEEYSAILK